MARDALIDPTTGDLVPTGTGDFKMVEGLDQLAQSVRIELATIRGTLFDDAEFGVPFLQFAFTKGEDLPLFTAIMRATLEGRSDIVDVPVFIPGFDPVTRKYTLTFKAVTTQGILDSVT